MEPVKRLEEPTSFESILYLAKFPAARARLAKRKYSVRLIKEAVRIYASILGNKGLEEAVKQTGVNKWTIKKAARAMRLSGELERAKTGERPANAKEQALVRHALAECERIGKSPHVICKRDAARWGLNGHTVWVRYYKGLIKL